jgi:hypothetical protein
MAEHLFPEEEKEEERDQETELEQLKTLNNPFIGNRTFVHGC